MSESPFPLPQHLTIDLQDGRSPKTSLRNEWQFPFPVSEVKAAAQKKRGYHKERLDYWKAERDKAYAAVEDSVAIRGHKVTGGRAYGAEVDNEKQEHLGRCETKVDDHRDAYRTYTNWVLSLDKLQGQLSLTRTDVEFFFNESEDS